MDFLKMLKEMDRNKLITGQLFFRLMGPAIELDFSSRDLFAVVGNIAVPKNSIKDEHQHVIAGFEHITMGPLLASDKGNGIDFKKKYHGSSLGQLLTEPIWKI